MSLYLTGNTSNITIDSTSGITFPNNTLQASAGRILQVVSTSINQGGSAFSTSNTSFNSTGFFLSITPTSATSKILVLASGALTQTSTGGTGALVTIYRGSTNLANGSTNGFNYYENSSGSGFQWVNGTMQVLDSPATTSSTTYTIYLRAVNNGGGAGTAYYNINYAGNAITLFEVGA